MSWLERGAFSRIRRNHGLEHATIHVLSRMRPRARMAGHSDPGGFWLLGELSSEDVYTAVEEALTRLRAGETTSIIYQFRQQNMVQ